MKQSTLLLAVIIIFSCSNSRKFDREVEKRALKTISLFDKPTIEIFKEWGYGTRGKAEIWQKINEPNYICFYRTEDTTEISIIRLLEFNKDFKCSININENKYHNITFKKIDIENLKVTAVTGNGKDTTIIERKKLKDIFPVKNPYEYFLKLSKVKNRLGIIGAGYRSDLGNFIEFSLTNQHILTYFPDSLYINPKFKGVWLKEFATGKRISKNWNLRKLAEPLSD